MILKHSTESVFQLIDHESATMTTMNDAIKQPTLGHPVVSSAAWLKKSDGYTPWARGPVAAND